MAGYLGRDDGAPIYVIPWSALTPTVAMDIASALAPATGQFKVMRPRRLVITNPGSQTGAALVTLQLGYAGAALGSGGTGISNLRPLDGAGSDPDFVAGAGGSARVGDTTPAAGFVELYKFGIWVPAAGGAVQPIIIPFGEGKAKAPSFSQAFAAAKAMVLKHPGAAGAAGFSGFLEFTADPE